MATDDENIHRKVLESVASMILKFPLSVTPPEIAQHVYAFVAETTGNKDPCYHAKQQANELTLSLYPQFIEAVNDSGDPLLAACKLAIAGNVIDLAPQSSYGNVRSIAKSALESPLCVNDYEQFKRSIAGASSILYLGDNAGEIVFDRILIEVIRRIKDLEICFVVRERPIINDATLHDAISTGMDRVAKVISSGSDAPATILSQCSLKVLKLYHSADVIIAKGQGNYESLNDEARNNIFFLLRVKCPVIARFLGARVGDAVLKKQTV